MIESRAVTARSLPTCESQKTACCRTSPSGSLRATPRRMSSVSGVCFCEITKIARRRSSPEHEPRRSSTRRRTGTALAASICISALSAATRGSSSSLGQPLEADDEEDDVEDEDGAEEEDDAVEMACCWIHSPARASPRRASSP